MSLHLIIDGYNLIRRSPSLSILDRDCLEKGRAALIQRLARYKRVRAFPITVVFDGPNQPHFLASKTIERGIRLVFSREGQKADDVIIQMTRQMREKAMVVTSDTQLQREVVHHDATVIPVEEFERKMEMSSYMANKGINPEDRGEHSETPRTQKKGPSRRLSKRARKAQQRIKKL